MSAPIRTRLTHVAPGEAALLTRLAGTGPAQLSVAPSSSARAWIVLEADPGGWELWLAPLAGPDGPLGLTGEDGAPDALRAALAMEAVEPLTADLERVWATTFRPVRLADRPPGLAMRIEAFACRALVAVRAEHGAPLDPGASPAPDRVAAVPVATEWRIAGPTLSLERLARIGRGDLILVPSNPAVDLAAADARWSGRGDLNARTVTLEAEGAETMTMTDQGWAGARTPVELVIDGGAVPVGTLAALAPGAVLPLEIAGDVLPVVVRAGGVRIGTGQLVAVGDAFGVVLTEVALPAPPSPAPRPAEQAPAPIET